MAKNFRITSRRKADGLHLTLNGDFDGMSAMELVYALKEYAGLAHTIYIETEGIRKLFPFGLDVFQKHFCFTPAAAGKVVFSGSPALQLAPRGISFSESRN